MRGAGGGGGGRRGGEGGRGEWGTGNEPETAFLGFF